MTNPCTCKAEHWQPHADSCPAKPAKTHTIYSTGRLFMDGAYTDENEWVKRKDYDILRGNLSLAEEGLANYALEVEAARRTSEYWKAEHLAGNEEIEQLKTTLFEAQQAVLREGIEVGRLQAESDAWDKLSLVQLSQTNEQLKQQLADTKADYLRRHNDAVDRYEEIKRLREFIEKRCCGSGVANDTERWRLIDMWRAEPNAHEPSDPLDAWKHMDSAPKDGTRILALVTEQQFYRETSTPNELIPVVVRWAGDYQEWSMQGYGGLRPTLWLPITLRTIV